MKSIFSELHFPPIESYQPKQGYQKGTIDQFYYRYSCKTYLEIVSEKGYDKFNQPNGPSLRYVEDPLRTGLSGYEACSYYWKIWTNSWCRIRTCSSLK